MKKSKLCEGCGVEVNRYKYGKRVFCSNQCYTTHRAKASMVPRSCVICKQEFLVARSRYMQRDTCDNPECVEKRLTLSVINTRGPKTKIATCHPDRKHIALGLCYECYKERDRERMKERSRRWRASNPEKAKAVYRKARYGVEPEFFDTQFAKQNGLCAVCKVRPATDIDHSHVTEKARGLLCGSCNRALGLFNEDVTVINSAIAYLNEWGM